MNSLNNYLEIYQRRLYLQTRTDKKKTKRRTSSYDQVSTTKRTVEKNDKNTLTFKQKLRKIFDLYAQMGESVYTTKLKQKKFIKLCIDMDIPDKSFPVSSLELLIIKILTKKISCIDFDKFIELLHAISKVKIKNQSTTSNENKENPFKLFLKKYPIKLYDKLFTDKICFSSQGSFRDFNNNNIITLSQEDNTTKRSKPYVMNKISTIAIVDDLSISNDYEELLRIISVPMFELYKFYFPLEMAAHVPNGYSIKQFIRYLTDFDLFPYLLTKDELFQIFQNEIDTEVNELFVEVIVNTLKNSTNVSGITNLGKYFNYFKFLKAIFKIADLGLDKIPLDTYIEGNTKSQNTTLQAVNRNKYTTFEKICLILERMELSETFTTINLKPYCMTHIISPKFLEKIKKEIISREENIYENLGRNAKDTVTLMIDGPENNFKYYDYIIDKYSKELSYIFNFYSEESVSLKQSRFIKILIDCELIQTPKGKLSTIAADLIFISITNPHQSNVITEMPSQQKTSAKNTKNNSLNDSTSQATPQKTNQSMMPKDTQGTLLCAIPYKPKPRQSPFTFHLFVNSIELLAKKIYPNRALQEGIDNICMTMISKLCQESYNEDNLLDLIYKEKEINEEFERVYTIFFQTIYPLFNIYVDNKGLVSLKSFYTFAYDFGLFPQSITKTKLLGLFKNSFNYGRDVKDDLEYENGLNHQMFCDVLIQIAFEIPYGNDEPNDIEKIIYLADRLSQSEGINKIVLSLLSSPKLVYGKNFDMMALFKENYPMYFQDEKNTFNLNMTQRTNDNYQEILDEAA